MTLPIVRKRSNKSNTKRIVACACSPGSRLIVRHHVDDHDRLATPSKLKGAVNQRVLQSRRPLMPFDLLNSRLPNVGDREACAMLLVDFSGTMPPRRGTKSASLIGCLLKQERCAEAVAEPSVPAAPRHRAVAPAAASAKQAEADIRSSRDPKRNTQKQTT